MSSTSKLDKQITSQLLCFQTQAHNIHRAAQSHKQVWPRCLECGLQLPSWRPDLAVHEGELDIGIVELLGVVPLAQLEINRRGLDDLDARGSHSVARSHLSVHLLHSTIHSSVTVLLVHVVVTGSALVAQPDTKVLDRGWVALKDLP
jgi:hypothetical protein